MKSIVEIKTLDELQLDLIERGVQYKRVPVDVEAIAIEYGIAIDDTPRLDSMDKMGLVDGLSIWINPKDANEYTALRRHIVAHELGHIVLHKPIPGEKLFFQDSYESIRGRRDTKDVKEEECNEFAAELLIPSESLISLFKELSLSGDVTASVVFRRIAEVFDVPISLAERRIISFAHNSRVSA